MSTRVVAGAFLAFLLGSPVSAGHADESGWATVSAQEAGFEADLGAKIDAILADEGSNQVHAVVLIRDGKLVLERYRSGDDEKRQTRFLPRTRVAISPASDRRWWITRRASGSTTR